MNFFEMLLKGGELKIEGDEILCGNKQKKN